MQCNLPLCLHNYYPGRSWEHIPNFWSSYYFFLLSTNIIEICPSFLLFGRNVRWPRRMLPLVSHGEYADGTDRRTNGDGQTDGRQIVTLRFLLHAASAKTNPSCRRGTGPCCLLRSTCRKRGRALSVINLFRSNSFDNTSMEQLCRQTRSAAIDRLISA